ncbi:unnamed protein product [Periconia digitata]|uniref:Uncharacterized protein n=1 Tax=Periconia digitata TaxID=1303443 RepID=A0A9W4UE34_9PLEO|nr:unnamed protein product [Periconia digitata]
MEQQDTQSSLVHSNLLTHNSSCTTPTLYLDISFKFALFLTHALFSFHATLYSLALSGRQEWRPDHKLIMLA